MRSCFGRGNFVIKIIEIQLLLSLSTVRKTSSVASTHQTKSLIKKFQYFFYVQIKTIVSFTKKEVLEEENRKKTSTRHFPICEMNSYFL